VDYSEAATALNRNGANKNLLRALIAGAFQPQVAQISFPDKKFASSVTGTVEVDPDARTIKYFNQENGRVFIHPSSILFSAQGYPNAAAYLAYFTKMATSKVFIRDLTRKFLPITSYSIFLPSRCTPLTNILQHSTRTPSFSSAAQLPSIPWAVV
jgi:hypothetical protein